MRRQRAAAADQASDGTAGKPALGRDLRRRPLPPASQIRRERRALLKAREERLRDLGGLLVEMFRRDYFREDLVAEQAADVIALEDRLFELDALLEAVSAIRRTPPAARCECGAPIIWGSRFCAHCGRPLAGEEDVSAQPAGATEPAAEA